MTERVKQLASLLGEYFDLLLAMVGGFAVVLLGLTGHIDRDHLPEATLRS